MDSKMLLLRILHIVFGTFWVGTDVFVTFLLLPRLRALGRDIERPVTRVLMRVMPPAMMVSSVITAVTGVVLVGIMRGWNLNGFLASNWGWAMLAGFVGTLVALFVGFGLIPMLTVRFERLNLSIEGRAPTPDEDRQLVQTTARITGLARTNSVLLLIVVVAMAIARFV